MDMYPLFVLLLIFSARINTSYHPQLLMKKYFKISNKTIAKLFISQRNPFNSKSQKNTKGNTNKLLLSGVVFYILVVIYFIFSLLMHYVIPTVSFQQYEVDSRFIFLSAHTTNDKMIITSGFMLLFAEIEYNIINSSKSFMLQTKVKKFMMAFYTFSILAFIYGFIYMAYDFVSCFN